MVRQPVSLGVTQFLAGRWPLAILLLLAALPYFGILRNDFTYTYDDRAIIVENPYVHNFQHLREVLTTTLFANQGAQGGAPYYRPVAMLGFLLCYQVCGPRPFGFHLLSLVLNMAVVAMVFLLAGELFRDRAAALAAAVLFALHPVHVEAVAWISAVTDVEVTLFCLLTFWFFLQAGQATVARRGWSEGAMVASFALAVLSKEQALMLPVLATAYEHFYRADRKETTPVQKAVRYGPLWLVTLGYLLLRVHLMGAFAHSTQMHVMTTTETLLSALALTGQYLGKLLWPVHLLAFHPFRVSTSIVDLPVLAGAGAVAMGALLFYVLWQRAPAASFGILWLFATLMPVLNARWMSAYVLAERYLYLPSVGFCLVAGWACMALWRALSRRQGILRTGAVAAAFTIIALCIFRISWRVLDWQNDITLYTESLKTVPDDYRLHDALGLAYWVRGDAARAEPEWQETLRLEPHSAQTLTMLGALYARQRRFELAVPLLGKALQLNPEDTGAYMSLGALYAETGKPDRAEEQFRAAVRLSPMNFTAHNLLGKLYFDSNRLAEAEQQFSQSLECEPNLAAYDHLGFIYMRQGERNRAEEAFKKALAMNSADSHAHFNLGLIYAATGRAAEAEMELNAALAVDPGNPEILSALKKLHP